MSSLYSRKSCIILAMCLCLYVILSSLLLFYVEECAIDSHDLKEVPKLQMVRRRCISALGISGKPVNVSVDACVDILGDIIGTSLHKKKDKCRFGAKSYLPWLHCVTFSLLTIGVPQMPLSVAGKSLLLLTIIVGIVPVIRFFIHTGVMVSRMAEHFILSFELKVLNRSPRMIHMVSRKIIFLQATILASYNLTIAIATSSQFYRTHWTYPDSLLFWISGMITTGHGIEVLKNEEFYSNGGWRILCLDFAMILEMVLVSGIFCSVVERIHKASCPAASTIRHAFKTQNPEVYLQIKPLKSHL